jgi:hypothetical protein
MQLGRQIESSPLVLCRPLRHLEAELLVSARLDPEHLDAVTLEVSPQVRCQPCSIDLSARDVSAITIGPFRLDSAPNVGGACEDRLGFGAPLDQPC